jgi:uncharacterized protein DUF4062
MKVYISATFRDLQKHRLAVATVLRRMGHQPIGMEDYVAEGARPLHRCLADVTTCDAYVGIIAWRYGFVPADPGSPGTLIPTGTSLGSTSITEFEFRQAVYSAKPVLVFLLDPDADWPSSQFDAVSGDGEQGKAIARLRQEVGQQYVVGFFRTPEELASLVSAAVYRVEMNRQMNLESLRIEPRFNQPFVRNGPVQDSTLMEIKNVIAGPQQVQALQINIGQGMDWWLTRLYFLSSLAADLTLIEVIVFVGDGETFIGIIDPKIVRERLAQAYPMIKQYEDLLAQSGPPYADLLSEVDRRAGIWTGQMQSTGGEDSKPIFVTRPELVRWFTPYLITQAIDSQSGDNAALQMQRLMDWPMRFVPMLDKGRFDRVVDKQALAEQIARIFVREQVSRAISMTR